MNCDELPTLQEVLDRLPDSRDDLHRHPALKRPGSIMRLLDRIEELRNDCPKEVLKISWDALAIATKVPRFFSEGERSAAVHRSLIALGGVHRTLAMFQRAEVCYLFAYEILRDRTAPPAFIELCGKLAFLRRDQRKFTDALEFADTGLRIAQEHKVDLWIPRMNIIKANILVVKGQIRAGIEHYYHALDELPASDSRFHQAATQSVATAICLLEELDLADLKKWLAVARSAAQAYNGSHAKACMDWLEGIAANRFGEAQVAEQFLKRARSSFLSIGEYGYATIVSMDLSAFLLTRGRQNEAKNLAAELFPALKALRLNVEACAALKIYFEAIAKDQLDMSVVRMVKGRLRKS